MSRTKLLASLDQLQRERRRLLLRLTRRDELAVGTVSVISRKCGNPTCHCARRSDVTRHPQVLFLFVDDTGQRRCKFIRRADEEQILRAKERYGEFKEDLRRLDAINQREKQILIAIREDRALHYE